MSSSVCRAEGCTSTTAEKQTAALGTPPPSPERSSLMYLQSVLPVDKAAPPTFSQLALDKLKSSGISPAIACAAGLFSVDNAKRELDPEFLAHPALVIPYFDLRGGAVMFIRGGTPTQFVRVRYLDHRAGADGAHPKYMSFRASGVRAYFPKGTAVDWPNVAADASRPIVITEGELKALKACSLGVPTIGLGGVDSFTAKEA